MAQKEKLKKLFPPSGGPLRGARFRGCGLIAPVPTKVSVREPFLPNPVQFGVEYRCSTGSEMPARQILLLHPRSDEARPPWFASCLAQTRCGCAHAARHVLCRRAPE